MTSSTLTPRITLTIILLLTPFFLSAQMESLLTGAPSPEGENEVLEETIAVPVERATPRATFTTFLSSFSQTEEALGRDPLAVATDCLDLGHLPVHSQRVLGPDLAIQLKDIVDRITYVILEDVPNEAVGSPWVFHRDESGSIVLAATAEGDWRFTQQTIQDIPSLLAAVEQNEVVEGVTEAKHSLAMKIRERIPESLQSRVFLLETWHWMALAALLLIAWIIDRLVVAIIRRAINAYLKRRTLHLDEGTVTSALRPAGLLALAMVFRAGVGLLGLPPGMLEILMVVSEFIATVSVVWIGYNFIDVLSIIAEKLAAKTASKSDDTLIPLVRAALKVVVVALGLLFILENAGVNVTALVAGIGLGGIAVALAAKDTVENLFGSITVLMERPFEMGDAVKIGSVEGTVEQVGVRSTRIRTYHNSLITLPNANLISNAVENLGARRFRRWKTTLGLTYDTPPAKIEAFCKGVRELVHHHPHTRKEGIYVHLNEFSASSLDILLYAFIETTEWAVELESKQELMIQIIDLAETLGVEFAFPTQTLHLENEA